MIPNLSDMHPVLAAAIAFVVLTLAALFANYVAKALLVLAPYLFQTNPRNGLRRTIAERQTQHERYGL
jgi:hypothetical protein